MKKISIESQRRFGLIPIAVVVILAIVLSSWFYLNSQSNYTGKTESITIGLFPDFIDTPIYLADELGLFSANGLNVTVKNYETGLAASNALLKGEVDLSVMSEFVAVGKALQKENVSVIANYDKSQRIYLIARKDRGIQNVSDIWGKKVGVARGTITEFYLGRFLELHGMNVKDATLVDIKPSQNMETLCTGNVDAVIGSQSDIDNIRLLQANETVTWPAQNGQLTYNLVAGRIGWITKHPDLARRVLQSLDKAEDYLTVHPTEAKAIIKNRLNYSDMYIAGIWPEHQFSLSLDQSLVLAMEDEGRWMINNNLTSEKTIPDFRDYVYKDGLEAVRPGSVNIIG